ncbi:wobble nucleotide-excising tRNase [Alkalibaculum bacchi]|uniref:Nuclease SbcCD subunit C n=1 Tax=Alkalibaculum bacchi TaxID=645887 RepID=A0A366I078_9FIRM|nr:AAA family ATPase [Alkalibaculum bacchi]RBP60365.1 wobble nucleotide-excising tRNase [Alkalibaculum bacchi]
MISKIFLDKVATYNGVEFAPSKVNYIYGGNGTGKTTISKVIANKTAYPNCALEIEDEAIDKCVYNCDFVKEHFSQSSSVKGIFTLGKDTKDAQGYIAKKKDELDQLTKNIKGNQESVKKLKGNIQTEIDSFEKQSWITKKKYEELFRVAFEGYMGSMKAFSKKCLDEKTNTSELIDYEKLVERKNVLFNKSSVKHEQISNITVDRIVELEKSNILSTPIIGKEDTQIGELINKLKNSDWVNTGRKYLIESDSKCPFCQQPITNDLNQEIEDFFDESYEKQFNLIKQFKTDYESCVTSMLTTLETLRQMEIKIIDLSVLDEKIEILKEKNKINLMKIDKKLISPSNVEKLEIISDVLKDINSVIASFQDKIKQNNQLLDNIEEEKNKLKNEIWRFVFEELKPVITEFEKKVSGYKKGIDSIRKIISKKSGECRNLDQEIKTKEAEMTSTEYTKNEINTTLKKFGFVGFTIDDADAKGSYKIVRMDGCCVEETLSEGEYTFITFLYFYQMIKGSIDPTGITRDKIIVIDDPISSLDSNVLFIVSHLVKDIVSDCNNNKNNIKQVFVLTHNIYFHKEVTFRGARENLKQHEKFWIVKKLDESSSIDEYVDNPIQTTYEMLWRELDNLDKVNKATIFNTLRRILEYYFNIIGGLDYEKCIHSFDGEDKLLCRALVSWINDGSHFVNDDMVMYVEPEGIEKYLSVFKLIFDNMGHLNHYNMMMKIENSTETVT